MVYDLTTNRPKRVYLQRNLRSEKRNSAPIYVVGFEFMLRTGQEPTGREYFMRTTYLALVLAAGIAISASMGFAQQGPGPAEGPNKLLKTAKVGGEGGFDYITADIEARRLYVPRNGPMGQLMVFNLDTLEPAGS